MADNSVFNRLKKLFSTDVIIRNVGGNQLKVIDTDHIQSGGNIETNRRVDKWSRVYQNAPGLSYYQGQLMQSSRIELFRDYEAMDTDSIIASALDIYADECTSRDEFGDVLTIRSQNDRVHKVLRNLFYDVLNIEFNMWPWARNMLKLGDFYLHLNIAEKYGVIGVDPISAYELIREERFDPENPHRVRFRRDVSSLSGFSNVIQNGEEYDNYEIAHFRLLTDTNFLPYGRSIIEPARKVWKQIVLMEDAMLIHRIMRAADKRIFKIDIGNIPPNEVDAFMELTINKMKKVPYMDPETGQYNLKFNMQNMMEDFYLPVRGGESGTSIDNLAGLTFDSIQDIEYLKNRLLGSLKIPKAYLGFEEDTSGKATLASQDFRFARTVERIQRIMVSELYKIAIIHLTAQGFSDDEVVDFELSFTAPSTVYEKEKIELWTSKMTLAGDMIDKKLFSKEFIYSSVFNLSPEMYNDEMTKMALDNKDFFRLDQIKAEGNDPVKTGQSFGTPHDIANLYKGNGGVPKGYDDKVPQGGWPGAGRPEIPGTYRTHDHPLGWDPLGNKAIGKVYEISDALAAAGKLKDYKMKAVKRTIVEQKEEKPSLLDESGLLDE